MNTRQIIILVITGILAVYTGYIYLFKSPSDGGRDNPMQYGELKTFTEETSLLLNSGKLLEQGIYSIDQAESKWQRNPFFAHIIETEKEEDVVVEKTFTYSGFLESGGTRIAIINGLEYEAGETLNEEGFVLQGVSPERVVIGIMGKKQTLSVPFSE